MNTNRNRKRNLIALTMFHHTPDDPNAGGGGGGGGGNNPPPTFDVRSVLSDDIKADPLFDTVKAKDANEAINILGKNNVHLMKKLGVGRIEKPNDKWTPEQWKNFHKEIGVPETHDKYSTPDFKFAEGLQLVPEKLDAYKKVFHELGLTPTQAAKLQEFYFKDVNEGFVGSKSQRTQAENMNKLKLAETYGDKLPAKLDMVTALLKKHGSEELVAKLNEAGLSGDPAVVQFLVGLSENLMEDNAGGGGGGLPLSQRAEAALEIERLKGDKEFQRVMNTRNDPGHKGAVDKWLALHKAAL